MLTIIVLNKCHENMSLWDGSPDANIYMFVHFRAEENPADRPGEPRENSERD